MTSSGSHETQFVASDFWSALSEGISGLREIIEDSEDEAENGSITYIDTSEQTEGEPCVGAMVLFPIIPVGVQHDLPVLSHSARKILLNLYLSRVDTVYKIVHWPTTVNLVETNPTNPTPSISNQALEHAIYFMALCTITDSEAQDLCLGIRASLLNLYILAVETLLGRSNLLQDPSVTTLQALVIYLVRSSSHTKFPLRFC